MSMASKPAGPIVLQLTRVMTAPPEAIAVVGFRVRTFCDERDVDLWLDIRRRAFAKERVGVRGWTRDDFRQEFFDKPWWDPERLWFVEPVVPEGEVASAVATVALAARGDSTEAQPVVHWLAVLPGYRRRGLGRLLMNTLERYCWEHGFPRVALETHRDWDRAVQFYQALGYRAGEAGDV
ncbi:MAG: GNAT family N-acetyltransferase [Planctomycetota bacterium]|nr:MAG: GNAT family N-acetyltransferase [Planctomycetota bacterium]REJ67413.1 MAG: GNAT family N-acetyltransferase [Planctomycetota bacterium]REJ89303.1 MAG: GNAT family N-acetyltransferase [Planctomycetota bacterium]REK22878.1 MAG: GNAT family N-acetyltransferase [Planctomycetota bacterium]REK37422.1 MAG: GNAT family N-acetyltransferase [Planctomycetota bacterium]